MATTNDLPVSRAVSVIGPQFVSPNPLVLKIETYAVGKLVITDINNIIILKVKPCDTTFHRQRWILDANDRPIVKLREKGLSAHNGWNVFRGESKADSDIIFSTRKSSIIQINKICVNAYLGNKMSSKDDYNFQIKGNWSKKNFSINYMGDSSKAIAQVSNSQLILFDNTSIVQPSENRKSEKDNIMVTINPNVDYAFVVALIAIVDGMNNIEDPKQAKTVHGVEGMMDIAGAMASSS